MKKLFFACLMMLAGSAWSEWLIFDETASANHYFDPATIRKEGNTRQVWILQDWRKRDKNDWRSIRMKREFDCKQERYRLLNISTHSEPMAGGKVLATDGEDKIWSAIAPGTADETILKIVCAK